MSTAVREQVLLEVVAKLTAMTEWKRLIGRGNPVGQSVPKEKRPAAFLVELAERPLPGQVEEVDVFRLFFGIIILGSPFENFEGISPELNALEAAVYVALENHVALKWPLRKVARDEPEANQSLPTGSTMPVYRVDYAIARGSPYVVA